MVVLMTRRLFSEEVRVSSNVAGHNKNKLNPQIITYIRKIVLAFFPSAQLDTSKEWGECVIVIDESSRRWKNKPLKSKNCQ